jgi:osmotically-inducible protein OsmY
MPSITRATLKQFINNRGWIGILLATVVLGPWALSREYDPNPRSEAMMVSDVRAALQANPVIHSGGIEIAAKGAGTVILTGRVPSAQEREAAIHTASNLSGIHTVMDHIRVGPSAPQADLILQSNIEVAIEEDPHMRTDDIIDVKVQDGKADLGGIVDHWSDHHAATHDAFHAGAKTVLNHIRVREDPEDSMKGFFYHEDPKRIGA